MATIIKPKRSLSLGVVPTISQLADGEIAVNIPDQRIYIRDGANVRILAQAPSGLTAQWIYIDYNTLIYPSITIGVSVQKRYLVDSTLGSFEINLPTSSLSVGDSIEIADPSNYWGINSIKINTMGNNKILDQVGNLQDGPLFLDVSGMHIFLIWRGNNWGLIH